jgi:predicted nuclease with TOPRIM domain
MCKSASRKLRKRKKVEEEELRKENDRLREERLRLLRHINDLEAKLNELVEPDLDLENELLKAQLEQHRGFIDGFLQQLSVVEPSGTASLGEVCP